MAEAWTEWEQRTVNGVYPLRRFLSASDHSAVFLTESSTEGFLNAAIKLVPANPATSDQQLWCWKTAATFSHPHLIRLLDSGSCEIDGRQLLFVVMEYAEESLAQVLPYRALTAEEVRELLVPTLDALACLHQENWIQGQLRPSNFLVVNDQLKLAIDTIRPVGIGVGNVTPPTLYDAPETQTGEISFATDMWGLAVTLVEALTQHAPSWPSGRAQPPSFPPNLPVAFAQTIQRCFSINPADRPTIAELRERTKPDPPVSLPAAAPSAAPASITAEQARQEIATRTASRTDDVIRAERPLSAPAYACEPEPRGSKLTGTLVAAIVVVVVALWGGLRLLGGPTPPPTTEPRAQESAQPTDAQSTTTSTDTSRNESASSGAPPGAAAGTPSLKAAKSAKAFARSPQPPEDTTSPVVNSSSDAVIHEEIPKVSLASRQTIHGRIKIAVKVSVDRSGNVVRDTLENPSSSRYFNRIASEAARKWRFASADSSTTRQWLLHFEFGRDGTTVRASPMR